MVARKGAAIRLKDKRIAVIGAGSVGPGWGNGKAAAVRFAQEGARVLCVDSNPDAAAQTVALIGDTPGIGQAMCTDVTTASAGNDIAAQMQRLWGGIDVMHFNVGISSTGGVLECSPDEWARVFDVNLTSALRLTKAVLPLMRTQKSGAFVFVSSLAAIAAGPYSYVSYEVSKAALCRLSKSIAAENAPFGIRSNTILPGVIDTPHVPHFVAPHTDLNELARSRAALVPMGRQGTAWDVANAALFLASDESGFMTGQDLIVDGGMSL